ncbi:MAG: putative DNA binding domain-containing protein [Deltaproteobacteria bacterium]|nr:putative DNA binding domain-containing protein [Deltaproteobacteria bacterium]
MKESQNIEWKESWRDEYIKWICGFANANGGTLYIGKDDKGKVTGISDTGKLLKDIPNKVRDILGIMIDVNLITEKGKDILEIIAEPYPYPVSYKGQYHYRSGSTKQELKGAALDKFLLRKQGKHWDGVPVPHVFVKDLDDRAFEYFREKAAKSNRLTSEVLEEKNDILIEKLHLTDNQYLKRAAVLLFHPDPEKYVTGAYVKIGYFKTDDDLLFQDEIHGDLFSQVEKTMDLLLTKYQKATIEYRGLSRIEEYPFPEAALREALLNSIAHKDYSSANPIQISVYSDKIIFWNEGQLPENWTISQLKEKHPSKPFNPIIANVFFRAGLIEAWGRGIFKIIHACRVSNSPEPVFKCDFSGFFAELFAQKIKTLGEKLGEKLGENRLGIIKLMKGNQQISIAELSRLIGISTTAIERNIKYLKEKEIIKRVGGAKGGHWEVS